MKTLLGNSKAKPYGMKILCSSRRRVPSHILALGLTLIALVLPASAAPAQSAKSGPWLFAGFQGNSEDGVYYALSQDGYHWTLANGGQPVVLQTETGELMRDPFVQRGPDNTFRMVWTWAWRSSSVIGYAASNDLVHWTPHTQLPVMAPELGALNVWAPALYYNPAKHNWLIFWSSTIPGRFPGDDTGDGNLNHRIWSTTTPDFHTFTPATVFFDPGYSVIDATLIPTPQDPAAPFRLVFKDERKTPLQKHLLTASGPTLEGPWTNLSEPFSETWSEGAAILPVPKGYLAYYDHYRDPQHYRALFTSDWTHWTPPIPALSFPSGMRHGSFLAITQGEYKRLAKLKPAPATLKGARQ